MQNVSLLIAIAISAAAIIGVILWRFKPADSGEANALHARVGELTGQLQILQQKSEAKDNELRAVMAELAALTAGAAGADLRFADALQERDEARREAKRLQDDLSIVQKAAARAQSESSTGEIARGDLQRRLDTLDTDHKELNTKYQTALQAEAKAAQSFKQQEETVKDLVRRLEMTETDLHAVNISLAEALAKQESDSSAARHFENIGQKVLADAMEQAKKGIDEITGSLKISSVEQLTKHAESVTKTLEPLQNKLEEYEKSIAGLRKDSTESYGGLKQQIEQLQQTERTLHDQAKALTTALSASPKMRGSYGELQLKQLVEFAGMQNHCHFETQVSVTTEDGKKIPDMIVYLPEGQKVIVDAKAVMDACVQALQATDDAERTALLKRHCDNVRSRVQDLSSKNYFRDHENAVEAVVLFLPAEHLYNAAMENDPDLTQFAMSRNVIVCGPNSLLMLLKVSSTVWRRAAIEDEHRKIVTIGNDIYKYVTAFVNKYATVGTRISQLTSAYNDAAGTLDSRLIPAGRKMGAFQAVTSAKDVAEAPALTESVHSWRSEEARKSITALPTSLFEASVIPEGALVELAATDGKILTAVQEAE